MKKVTIAPPGTWCINYSFIQNFDFSKPSRTFLEVGPGEGFLAKTLCNKGLRGCGIEFSKDAANICKANLSEEISDNRFELIEGDFFKQNIENRFNYCYSLMVMEHIEQDQEFLNKMAQAAVKGGKVIIVVPARMDRWGSEDDLVGHFKRYCRKDLRDMFTNAGLKNVSVHSLCVPVSNLLYNIGDRLVKKGHTKRENDGTQENKTKQSGIRDIPYRDVFPAWFGLLLNKYTMAPFYIGQQLFYNTDLGLSLIAVGEKNE